MAVNEVFVTLVSKLKLEAGNVFQLPIKDSKQVESTLTALRSAVKDRCERENVPTLSVSVKVGTGKDDKHTAFVLVAGKLSTTELGNKLLAALLSEDGTFSIEQSAVSEDDSDSDSEDDSKTAADTAAA
jgi:hypothetical protein